MNGRRSLLALLAVGLWITTGQAQAQFGAEPPTTFTEVANTRTSTSVTVAWSPPVEIRFEIDPITGEFVETEIPQTVFHYALFQNEGTSAYQPPFVNRFPFPGDPPPVFGAPGVYLSGNASTHTFTGLKENTQYTFSIHAATRFSFSEGGPTDENFQSSRIFGFPATLTIRTSDLPKSNAPQMLQSTGKTDTSVSLSWLPPVAQTGAEITGYRITTTDPDSMVATSPDLPATARTYTVADLLHNTAYRFAVVAIVTSDTLNAESEASDALTITTDPRSNPPQRLQRTSQTDTSVSLRWRPPEAQTGVEITGYRITTTDPHDMLTTSPDLPATARIYTVAGLRPFTAYSFTVVAIVTSDTGTVSEVSNTLTITTDRQMSGRETGHPLSFIETPNTRTTTSVTVQWGPTYNYVFDPRTGMSPLELEDSTYYALFQNEGTEPYRPPSFRQPPPGAVPGVYLLGDTLSHTFTGLKANTEYTFSVHSTGRTYSRAPTDFGFNIGQGFFSRAATLTTYTNDLSKSSAPQMLQSTGHTHNSVSLSWLPPQAQTGAEITGYRITPTNPANMLTTSPDLPATARTYTVSGLRNNTAYSFAVVATVIGGAFNLDSEASNVVTVTTVAQSNPPLMFQSPSQTDTSINLSWLPPAAQAGVQITGYRVTTTAADNTLTTSPDLPATARTYTVSGLTKSAEYRLLVAALVTSADFPVPTSTGAELTVISIASAPSAPRNFTLRRSTHHSLDLEWEIPSRYRGHDDLLTIVGYGITGAGKEEVYLTSCRSFRCRYTLTDLMPATTYALEVRAYNLPDRAPIGRGASVTLSATTAAIPAPNSPRLLRDSRTDTSITMTWEAPFPIDNERAVVGYVISLNEPDPIANRFPPVPGAVLQTATLGAEIFTHTFSSLPIETEYLVTIYAYNLPDATDQAGIGFTESRGVSTGGLLPDRVSTFTQTEDTESPSSISVSWQPGYGGSRGTGLLGFVLEFRERSRFEQVPPLFIFTEILGTLISSTTLPADARTHIFTDLPLDRGSTFYQAIIYAYNLADVSDSAGHGPEFSRQVKTIGYSVPAPTLTAAPFTTAEGRGGVTLNWMPPELPYHTVTGYELRFRLSRAHNIFNTVWVDIPIGNVTNHFHARTGGNENRRFDYQVRAKVRLDPIEP